ncbi:MAG: hypothetical protein CMI16_04325 [Opitutaceae bacterium]|nr:hypothetical protein [Opitutaceae bacterium]
MNEVHVSIDQTWNDPLALRLDDPRPNWRDQCWNDWEHFNYPISLDRNRPDRTHYPKVRIK